jgi:CRP-like cAMP-binding protein
MTAPLRDQRPAKDDPTMAARLHAHRMLSAAPQAELDWLIERGTLGHWLPGDPVVTRGEPVNLLFFVLKGRLSALANIGGT